MKVRSIQPFKLKTLGHLSLKLFYRPTVNKTNSKRPNDLPTTPQTDYTEHSSSDS